jgi:hypothetical protein
MHGGAQIVRFGAVPTGLLDGGLLTISGGYGRVLSDFFHHST